MFYFCIVSLLTLSIVEPQFCIWKAIQFCLHQTVSNVFRFKIIHNEHMKRVTISVRVAGRVDNVCILLNDRNK